MHLLIVLFLINFHQFNSQINYKEPDGGWTGCTDIHQSPIDIPFYNKSENIIYGPYPSHYINRTYYSPINKSILTLGKPIINPGPESNIYKIDTTDLLGKVYVTIEGKYYSFSLQDIRFHVYSEHTFEGMKTELEMQLIHKWIPNNDIEKQPDIEYLGIAILFSATWDEDSELLSVLAKAKDIFSSDPQERHEAIPITTMDLNQFFNKKQPYYYYTGSGTTPNECSQFFHWFVMKKVEKMSWMQLEQIHTILMSGSVKYKNGNSRRARDIKSIETFKIEYIDSNTILTYVQYSLLLLYLLC